MTNGRNQSTGSEAMVRMLATHGVKHIFGLCGDTSLPFYDALAQLDHGMTHILTRDERHAAYMADAYARVTGRVGVCEGPSGGGATYILPGVVEASESSVPVLAITTDVATTSHGRFPLTELDQEALYQSLTKWNGTLSNAATLPRSVRRAFREMTTGRPGAAHLCLPFDVQKTVVPKEEIWADAQLGTFPALRASPDPEDVKKVLAAIRDAERPVIICGGGVVLAGAERFLELLAEGLFVTVATTVSCQGSLPETHPLCLGVVGSNGDRPETRAVVNAADLVVFIGCRAGSVTTERWRSPGPGVKIIHIDSDPAVIGASYRTDLAICPDAYETLGALVDAARAWQTDSKAKKRETLQLCDISVAGEAVAEAKAAKRAFPAAGEKRRPVDQARAGHRDSGAAAAGGRRGLRRSGHALPLFLGLLHHPQAGADLHHQPGARGARLCAGGLGGSAGRATRRQGGGGDGRRELRHVRRPVRDHRPAGTADHRGGILEQRLRLDQGRSEIGRRRALLLGRLLAHRPCRGGGGLWGEELAGRGPGRAGAGAEQGHLA